MVARHGDQVVGVAAVERKVGAQAEHRPRVHAEQAAVHEDHEVVPAGKVESGHGDVVADAVVVHGGKENDPAKPVLCEKPIEHGDRLGLARVEHGVRHQPPV